MNKILTNVAIAIATVSLVSCSTNTQKENTVVGALGGGVIGGLAGSAVGGGAAVGVGIVVGALVGGVIGHSMDNIDKTHAYHAIESGKTVKWHNKKTNTSYSVTPSRHYITVNGNPNCRKYVVKSHTTDKATQMYGIACRQSDGTWKKVK